MTILLINAQMTETLKTPPKSKGFKGQFEGISTYGAIIPEHSGSDLILTCPT